MRLFSGFRSLGLLLFTGWISVALHARADVVASGESHSCALTREGRVECWGRNDYGQLGDGTQVERDTPVVVPMEGDFVDVGVGAYHSCALRSDGTVTCWGFNGLGQLGNGTLVDSSTPVDVVGLNAQALAIAAGPVFTCALMATERVKCWGDNGAFELGNDAPNLLFSATPVDVAFDAGVAVVRIASSNGDSPFSHTCAATSAGEVYCWGGMNAHGELGIPAGQIPTKPALVSGIQNAVSVAVGDKHSCALTSPGDILCWGDNNEGQLGDATTFGRHLPAQVVGLNEPASLIAAGGRDQGFSCALMQSGAVYCWGSNVYGQLAAPDVVPQTTVPVATHIVGADGIGLGETHGCARIGAGQYTCWGGNTHGQIGNGTAASRATPRHVEGLAPDIVGLAAGSTHTCALSGDGSVNCWGDNRHGQLGDGSTARRLTPGPSILVGDGATRLAAGGLHSCAISVGNIYCWGYDHFGQLGVGDTSDRLIPTMAVGLSAAQRSIATGTGFTCAIDVNGGVECWGIAADGELGDGESGTGLHQSVPVPVMGLGQGAVAVAAGGSHACALLSDGAVECWGYNGFGELGDGTEVGSAVPVNVDANALGGSVLAIAAGGYHSCALLDGGVVKCWGSDAFGELGDGNPGSAQMLPVVVQNLGGPATSIAAGKNHTCAVLVAGDVKCWGMNGWGELGDGTYADRSEPVIAALPGPAASLAVGADHNCAVLNSRDVYCWGDARNGQLGSGDTDTWPLPQYVRADNIFYDSLEGP